MTLSCCSPCSFDTGGAGGDGRADRGRLHLPGSADAPIHHLRDRLKTATPDSTMHHLTFSHKISHPFLCRTREFRTLAPSRLQELECVLTFSHFFRRRCCTSDFTTVLHHLTFCTETLDLATLDPTSTMHNKQTCFRTKPFAHSPVAPFSNLRDPRARHHGSELASSPVACPHGGLGGKC